MANRENVYKISKFSCGRLKNNAIYIYNIIRCKNELLDVRNYKKCQRLRNVKNKKSFFRVSSSTPAWWLMIQWRYLIYDFVKNIYGLVVALPTGQQQLTIQEYLSFLMRSTISIGLFCDLTTILVSGSFTNH